MYEVTEYNRLNFGTAPSPNIYMIQHAEATSRGESECDVMSVHAQGPTCWRECNPATLTVAKLISSD
jgi:hypothetical protein